jgi:hypothetical protein
MPSEQNVCFIQEIFVMTRLILCSVALMVAMAQAAVAAMMTIDETNFDSPPAGAPQLDLSAGGAFDGWTFTQPGDNYGWGGILSTGYSPFPYSGPTALWGAEPASLYQVVFLGGLETMSQTFSGFVLGTVTVSFYAQSRNGGYGPDNLQVMLDGTALTFGASTTITPGEHMILYTSVPYAVTAGSHTVAFKGLTHTDVSSMIDDVGVYNSDVPEPATLALLGLSLLLAVRRSRKN